MGLVRMAAAVAVAAGLWSHAAAAEDPHIARIVTALTPAVQVVGRPVTSHTLADEMATHHVGALSIAVAEHGRIVWAKAYGFADVGQKRPATSHTTFQAGSISKPVAASGAIKLIEQRKIFLDKPVNAQLTGWKIPDNSFTEGHPVTLRHLLTHTGGLTVHGFPGYAQGAPVPTVIQLLEGKPPANTPAVVVERTPGEAWNYSGGGITIAQLLMTEASGEPFPRLMRERVFGPLGMESSSYEQPPTGAIVREAATGYLRDGKPVEGRYHTYPEMAAAGLWTTPTDLVNWALALEDAHAGRSTRLMSQASAREMLTPGLGHWGLGIEVPPDMGEPIFTHGGDDWGFKAQLYGWLKGGRAVAVMASGDDSMVVVNEVVRAVVREYGWAGPRAKVITPVVLTEEQLRAYAGSYGKGFAVVVVQDGRLQVRGGVGTELIPVGKDKFVVDAGGGASPVTAARGADGKVVSMSALGLTLPRDP